MHGLEDKMEKKTWKELGMIQMFKSHMGILAGLLILCAVLSVMTTSFATVTNFLMWFVRLPLIYFSLRYDLCYSFVGN